MARTSKKSQSLIAGLLSPLKRDGVSWIAVMLLVVAVPLALLAAYQE